VPYWRHASSPLVRIHRPESGELEARARSWLLTIDQVDRFVQGQHLIDHLIDRST
jgi:hypothetical protein